MQAYNNCEIYEVKFIDVYGKNRTEKELCLIDKDLVVMIHEANPELIHKANPELIHKANNSSKEKTYRLGIYPMSHKKQEKFDAKSTYISPILYTSISKLYDVRRQLRKIENTVVSESHSALTIKQVMENIDSVKELRLIVDDMEKTILAEIESLFE